MNVYLKETNFTILNFDIQLVKDIANETEIERKEEEKGNHVCFFRFYAITLKS